MRVCYLWPLLVFMVSCATNNVSVDSLPTGAKVEVRRMDGSKRVPAGETPLALSSSQLESLVEGSGPILIFFEKDGYIPQNVLLTEVDSSFDLKLNIRLNKRTDLPESDGDEDEQEALLKEASEAKLKNELISELFDSQNLAREGNYDVALERLEKLREKEPRLSVIHELKGGIYLLKNDFVRALSSFREAVRYEPNNPETRNIIQYIEKRLGSGRLPANTSGGGN